MKRSLLAFAGFAFAAASQAAVINEIRVDQSGTDNDEFFELVGTAGESLNNLAYIVIGDGTGGSGVIESVTSLAGQSIAADGFFLVAESTFTLGATVDLTVAGNGLNFENADNVTHLLVSGFTGANGDDLDTDDDGVLNSTPWTSIVDSVALVLDPNSGDKVYSSTQVGPDGTFHPGGVYRLPDGTGGWRIAAFALPDPATTTPGGTNGVVPEPATMAALALGAAAMIRRRKR